MVDDRVADVLDRLLTPLVSRIVAGHTWLARPVVPLSRLVVRYTRPDHPERPWRLSALGLVLEKWYDRRRADDVLAECLACTRAAVESASPGHPDLGLCLSNAITALLCRPDCVDEAIGLARQAVALARADNAALDGRLSNLGLALLSRYDLTDDADALYEAADVLRAARSAADAERAHQMLGNYLVVLERCYVRSNRPAYVTEAITLARQALPETSGAERIRMLDMLASLLSQEYEATDDATVLDEAIDAQRTAIKLLPRWKTGERAWLRANLSVLLRKRHDHRPTTSDIDEAVALARDAAESSTGDPVVDAGRLAVVVNALLSRYESTRDIASLDEAIVVGRRAVAVVPRTNPNRPDHLSNLAGCLARTGSPVDMAEAVDLARAALVATPADHADRQLRMVDLAALLVAGAEGQPDDSAADEARALVDAALAGNALAAQPARWRQAWTLRATMSLSAYHVTGDAERLSQALDAFRRVLTDTPLSRDGRVYRLADLADALFTEYHRAGELELLAQAIDLVRTVADGLSPGHRELARLQSVLGNALNERAARERSTDLRDEAVTQLRMALAADRTWLALTNLASALHRPVDVTDARPPEVLAEAVDLAREAVFACPPDHVDRGVALSNLAVMLPDEDIGEAARYAAEAVRVTSASTPGRSQYLINLGTLLRQRWRREGEDPQLWYAAIAAYREAAEHAAAAMSVRVDAACAWGELAAEGLDWTTAVAGFEYAIGLLPMLAGRELHRADQQHHLTRLSGLSANAAACAVRLREDRRALALTEHSRGLLLAESLDTWPQQADLWRLAPDLARRFDQLCQRVAQPTGTDDRQRRLLLAEHWTSLLVEIRARPGLAGFLLPPSTDDLLAAAGEGPIIIVNASPFGPHALLVEQGDVRSVPLPDLHSDDVRDRADAFLAALDEIEDNEAGAAGRAAANQTMVDTLTWLWDAVALPVLTELHLTARPQGAPPRRVWWSSSGLMSVFPLHAAGTADGTDSVLHRTVSSYCPTIRTLGHTRARARADAEDTLLVVAPDDVSTLPGTQLETDMLRDAFPGAVTVLDGERAGRTRVLDELPRHAWAHFACHAISDVEDPSASGLILIEGEQNPLLLPEIERLRLPSAAFACLAACDTVGISSLPNEALHLTSAFHLAGYSSVVGTLWSVSDRISSRCMSEFYQHVLVGGEPIAVALHRMVRGLRARWPRYPSVWAAFVHTGW
jgi:tetratricopeptide (TPR) repeat protein